MYDERCRDMGEAVDNMGFLAKEKWLAERESIFSTFGKITIDVNKTEEIATLKSMETKENDIKSWFESNKMDRWCNGGVPILKYVDSDGESTKAVEALF